MANLESTLSSNERKLITVWGVGDADASLGILTKNGEKLGKIPFLERKKPVIHEHGSRPPQHSDFS